MKPKHEIEILLLRLPSLFARHAVAITQTPPIGLAYLASALRKNGINVSMFDSIAEDIENHYYYGIDNLYVNGSSEQDVMEAIPNNLKYLGISFPFSHEWPLYKHYCKEIKAKHPNIVIIAGGEHATAMPDFCLSECKEIDYIVRGEGEDTIVDLLFAIETNKKLKDVNGITFRENNIILTNQSRNRIKDLDEIKWPAWDLMPINKYLDGGYSFGVNIGRTMPLIASRGCPYKCTFCSNPQMWTTKWVARSAKDVVKEMKEYINKYQANNFDFYDLTAIVDKRWIVEFTKLILKEDLNITWQLPSGTRSEAIDDEVSELLYKSGCRNLSFSPESGSPETLKLIKKRIKPKNMLKAMKSTIDKKMIAKTNIIIGFPDERFKNVLETYMFIIRMALIGVHETAVWTFSAYPGSEIYNKLLKENKIVHTDEYFLRLLSYADPLNTVSWSNHFSKTKLQYLMITGLLLFYTTSYLARPLRLVNNIVNVIKNKPKSRLEHILIKIFSRKYVAN